MDNFFPGFCGGCVTGQAPRHASAEPEACHVARSFPKFMCRVSIPAQKEKGAGFKTRGGMRLPLVAARAWAWIGGGAGFRRWVHSLYYGQTKTEIELAT